MVSRDRLLLVSLLAGVCSTFAAPIEPVHASDRAIGTVSVSVGAVTVVPFRRPVERVAVVNPRVVEVRIIGNDTLEIEGKQTGETAIMVYAGAQVGQILVDVGMSVSGLRAKLADVFPEDQIIPKPVGSSVALTGSVGSPLVAQRAVELAKAYLDEQSKRASVLNFLSVKGRQQVQLRVKVAEVSRTSLRRLGANAWLRRSNLSGGVLAPSTPLGQQTAPYLGTTGTHLQTGGALGGEGGGVPHIMGPVANAFGVHLSTSASSVLPLSVALNLLQGRGLAKVLSEPTLVAYSGQKASFLAGGEFPIPIPQGLGQTSIEFKKYGVELDFTPTVLGQRSIHLNVTVSVSEQDTAGGVVFQGTSVPALTTRRGATTVRLRAGQSFAIAGLLQDRLGATSYKVPLLGDIPILGALFRQSNFERQERELVILVTADVVRPLKPGEVPSLPGEDEVSDPGPAAFFLFGTVDPEMPAGNATRAAGPVGYSE